MKRLSTTLLLISLLCTCGSAQSSFNTTLRDQIDYSPVGMTGANNDLNDVWGYVAPDGIEYALVGLRNRVSIVSLADPDNIVEVASVSGATSTWRDIKTYGSFAYVVADQGNDGILAIDLSNLPNGVSSQFFNSNNTPTDDLRKAHNIYIDQATGLAYIAGAQKSAGRLNSGGMVIYDVATTPGTPTFVAFAPSVYSHDVFVQNDLMYASEIYAGKLTIYDVSDPQNITQLGSTLTPRNFTHNAWASTDGNYVFTTDEKSNAPTAAYDVSDPSDIMLLDEYRPARSISTGTIPHNVHVKGNYLVISHYTDGVEIVDATDPSNMIQVAYFDTWTGANGGFNGSWGAYPFLPSGLVLASDIDNGLFVIDVDYQLAARLNGLITDRDTGLPLNNVKITFNSAPQASSNTIATGRFKTGIATPGTYSVTLSLPEYADLTLDVNMESGIETILDTFLIQRALPVRWAEFTAEPLGKNSADLKWATASEAGSAYFVVERKDADGNFLPVGRVTAAGQSAVRADYGFTDTGLTAGTYYYRLRQVDLDGNYGFSEVRELKIDGLETLRVYPNPVANLLRLSSDVSGPVRIYRSDGTVVRETRAVGRALDVTDLPAGQYWLWIGKEKIPFVKR